MLGFFFGFHARLGRLHFFFACIIFAVIAAFFAVSIAGFVYRSISAVGGRPSALTLVPVFFLLALVVWGAIALTSMRVRDIGWNPVYVLPVWWLFIAIDTYVAITMPQWSIGHGKPTTMVGAALTLVVNLALIFWPSTTSDMSRQSAPEPVSPPVQPVVAKPVRTVQTAARAPAVKKGFGRLGQ